jgi:putative transcriptional regulator
MIIERHPAPENLMSCAAGSMPETLAAVMACHLTMCPQCRQELSDLDVIGAALLEGMSPESLRASPPPSPSQPVTKGTAPSVSEAPENDVPLPLRKFAGPRFRDVPWRRIAPGISQHRIPLSHPGNASLKLIKVAPGLTLPEHGHSGTEMTLVLQGAFSDASGRYGPGDVLEIDESEEHSPVVTGPTDCICLVACEGPMRFRGLLARIVQRLTGF